ncbi:hypothetical protein C479_00797 [Halovivax asiaticus JCM 14624]|uniref:DUF35 domain-containing protein n=1 Tax=Halovivax asiaticus JCM 14624 TaxID=1227490 RepID=M0BUZ7_9EURY|nr:hypothetical protein [Halovivax asiaticus]ELZ14223.1 hypothetical protein C479_00797 [Halovivax asiaticus JCM 14624]
MSDADSTDDTPPMEAVRYDDGTITYPGHPVGPDGGDPIESIDLSEYTAEVLTWTTNTAPPPGVREPNTLAIVEFTVDGEWVRAIGQVDGDVSIGQTVQPVYVDELRDPEPSVRARDSQDWDGYRFEPVSE